jgi:energy-coupling factor transporter ATP-binding protein EcfA2
MTGAIAFEHVTFSYPGSRAPALADATFTIPEGSFVLVAGSTGAGKSTLLRAVNGLVPHFSGGTFSGRVAVMGRDTLTVAPRDLADVVAFVPQDPAASFVLDRVEDELAYAMENLGVARAAMRRRVEETLDLLDIERLRDREVRSLSGGEKQRVAIASALPSSDSCTTSVSQCWWPSTASNGSPATWTSRSRAGREPGRYRGPPRTSCARSTPVLPSRAWGARSAGSLHP